MSHTSHSSHNRPQGHVTRGKTGRNRLRRTDIFLLRYDRPLIERTDGLFADALFVDLGYGAEPITTIESSNRFRRVNPTLRVLGVEIDPERVEAAQPFTDEHTRFRLGGFNLPLREGESVRAIRAFNILRQYDESEVEQAWATLAQYLLPGGLLLEGTSDPLGRIWAANLLRKKGAPLTHEAVVFSTNFRLGFDPGMFQPVLPKNYIHRMVPGEWIHGFFEAWKRAAFETISMKSFGARAWFVAAATALAQKGYAINLRPRLVNAGYLVCAL